MCSSIGLSKAPSVRNHCSELGMCCVQVPIYAHVKELTDPQTGRRTALEVNYCKFLAYNGSYKLFGWIYIGEVGRVPLVLLLARSSTPHLLVDSITEGMRIGECGRCGESHACMLAIFG